jgi:antitoxin ChpS
MPALKTRIGATRSPKVARKRSRKVVAKTIKRPKKVGAKTVKVLSRKAGPKTLRKMAKGASKRVVVRKVGGSLMAAMPAEVVKDMGLTAGQTLAVAYDGERLILAPKAAEPKRYTLRQILASCNFDLPKTAEEMEWETAPRVGLEAL